MNWILELEGLTLNKAPILVLTKFLGDFREIMIYAHRSVVHGVLEFNKPSMS